MHTLSHAPSVLLVVVGPPWNARGAGLGTERRIGLVVEVITWPEMVTVRTDAGEPKLPSQSHVTPSE